MVNDAHHHARNGPEYCVRNVFGLKFFAERGLSRPSSLGHNIVHDNDWLRVSRILLLEVATCHETRTDGLEVTGGQQRRSEINVAP